MGNREGFALCPALARGVGGGGSLAAVDGANSRCNPTRKILDRLWGLQYAVYLRICCSRIWYNRGTEKAESALTGRGADAK